MIQYAANGDREQELPDVEMGADGLPIVHLGLQYEAAPQRPEPIAEPHYAAIPAWVVLVGVVGFALHRWGQTLGD